MNGYKCFYKGQCVEVQAETSYAAQQSALRHFTGGKQRAKVKGYNITVVLCEKDGEQVTHKPMM